MAPGLTLEELWYGVKIFLDQAHLTGWFTLFLVISVVGIFAGVGSMMDEE